MSQLLVEGAKSVNMYLPNTEWWHFKNRESHLETVSGNYLNEAEIDDTPLHVRGGCIIPTEDYNMANSNKVQPKNITLYVFPLKDVASGEIYVDDLNSINPIETKKYARYSIDYKNCTIKFKKVEPEGSQRFDWFVTNVHVFKAKEVKKLEIPGQSLLQFMMNYVTHVLTITANMPLDHLIYIKWYDDNEKCSMLP
ncbi:maltase-glucoamylase, intestinal [Caerostris darwini]|uniref:Maltase-glucoamylase, intestinal n=1 Tax=Caerostris darwini TaxID=1538125 RepID=A0AAV4QFL1_9ARAC|nr:maltase-glucoamylase, intestinal [Caerostris darwini]